MAQLAVVSDAPRVALAALDGDAHGVGLARRDQDARRVLQVLDQLWPEETPGVAATESAAAAIPPGEDCAVGGERERVLGAARDGDARLAEERLDELGGLHLRVVAVPQVAVGAGAPSEHLAGLRDGSRMVGATGDARNALALEIDLTRDADVDIVTVAQLAKRARAPRVHVARHADGEGV